MMMQGINWIAMLLAGGLLGLFYFGGLWLTVKHINRWKYPALVVSLSLMLRAVMVVGGFYGLTGGQWRELLLALTGFIVIRMIMQRRYGPAAVEKVTNRGG